MIKIKHLVSRSLALWACSLLGSALPAAAQITWDFATDTPTSGTPASLTVTPITQGNNFASATPGAPPLINSTSASTTYAGASGANNAGIAARTGALDTALDKSAYFEVTLTPAGGFKVALNSITFGSRRTGTGPVKYTLRSSADGYVGDVATGNLAAASTWALLSNTGLLLSSPTALTLRLYGHDGAGTAGAGTANWRIDDLVLNVTVTTSSGPIPTITSFSPASGAAGTAVTITGTNFGTGPTVSFNGTAATGASVNAGGTSITVNSPTGGTTGPITVLTTNGSVTSTTSYTYPPQPLLTVSPDATSFPENGSTSAIVSRPADAPLASSLTVSLASSNTPKATVSVSSIVIAAGELNSPSFTINGVPDGVFNASPGSAIITASAAGYLNGTVTVSVTNVDPPPAAADPAVVLNKFFNAGTTADTFELLVVGTGPGGSPVDMRGMIVKDFAGSMGTDGGGKYIFNDTPLLSAVKVGTLLVIDALGTSSDTTYSSASDFSLRLSLADTTYFTKSGTGTFDISTTDMLMIKPALTGGSPTPVDGVTGGMHVLASGTAGAQFNAATCAKLIATATTATNLVAIATNPTSTLADFNGSAATGGVIPSTVGALGSPNNPGNNGYIRSLRGITTLNGVGAATISNGTPASPLNGRNIFGRGLSSQTVSVAVLSDVAPNGTLTRLTVQVPAAFGTPAVGTVTVTGAGAGTPVVSVSAQTITVSGTAVTTVNPAVINIGGLITPSPAGLTADGRYAFAVTSGGSSGTLSPIALSASAVVIIPIESLRDVDAVTGVANDLNKVVAVEGVVTAPNFNTAQLSAFIQDGSFGINVFNTRVADFPALTRGNRIVVTGKLIQFAGLTEISPSFSSEIVDLGPGTAPTPLVVTAATLTNLSDPTVQETLEGRLITVPGLSSSSGTWAAPTTTPVDVVLTDSSGNLVTVRIALASTATSPPASYPASITGILSQATLAADTPFVKYILLPRDPADVVVDAVTSGYATWAAGFPGIGPAANDADGDNQSNYLEYALGTAPNDRASVQALAVTTISGKPGFSITKGSQAAMDTGLVYLIEGSRDLMTWESPTSPNTPLEEVVNNASTYTVRYLPATPARYYFRLKVGPPL